jgi:hypothetical protein
MWRVGCAGLLAIAALLGGCATRPEREVFEEHVPRFIELQEERSAATMHFAPGLYSLDSVDPTGFYYRAPQGVIEHSFGSFVRHPGGLFVSAANRSTMRGYVVWAGGTTKVGNFSFARSVFRD